MEMKTELVRTRTRAALLAGLTTLGLAALGPARGDGLSQVHPGYDMVDIQPQGKTFLVGGLDVFSDGRLAVCDWGNPGEVWIVQGADQGDKTTVKAQRYAYGMQQSLGCRIAQDTLYVMQMGELTQLVDTDGDGRADLYNKINDAFATSESLLGYAFDVVPFGGYFYATLSADVSFGGMTFQPPLPDRSSFIKMGRDNSLEYLAAGFRNPNGMGIGFGNKLFATDNQGSWLPSSKINYLQKGHFYGHRTNPPNRFQDQPETPPLAWLPHGEVSVSPGNILFMSEGIFKNQLLFAEEYSHLGGRIYRVSVQDVGGMLQGAILPFSGGLGTGVDRIAMGKGGVMYAGLLGADGSWGPQTSMTPGLKRLRPKDASKSFAFEMLAVRSMGPSTVELEFTSPVEAGAGSPAKYTVDTWTFTPMEDYGEGNKQDPHPLTVQSATVKPDGKTVVLQIAGLKEHYLVHIKLAGLKSADGQSPWGAETWLTLNKFGPGKVPDVAGCQDPRNPAYDPNAAVNDPAACLPVAVGPEIASDRNAPWEKSGRNRIRVSLPGRAFDLGLFDLRGVERGRWAGTGGGEFRLSAGTAAPGLYLLRLQAGGRNWSRLWVLEP
jgi:hypothetical protein